MLRVHLGQTSRGDNVNDRPSVRARLQTLPGHVGPRSGIAEACDAVAAENQTTRTRK